MTADQVLHCGDIMILSNGFQTTTTSLPGPGRTPFLAGSGPRLLQEFLH